MKKFLILGSLLLVVAIALSGCAKKSPVAKKLSLDEAKAKTEKFINTYLMQSGSKVKVTDISVFNKTIYKVKVDTGSGETIDSFVTADGVEFMPQALNMDDIANKATATDTNSGQTGTASEVKTKTDKPAIELFVMSYCPYGTQIEKGMLPVLEALGNKIDFQLKFVDYAMHGEKELTENLTQYCIQKDAPAKLASYLKCFLAEGKSSYCLKNDGLNVDKCVKATDTAYKVSTNYQDKNTWKGNYPSFDINKTDNEKYSVGGSPTLIINGEEVKSGRDPQSLLQTVCSAFKTAPKECEAKLSSDTPSSGFGFNTAANSGSTADCGQ